jgi:hypothetical protein
MKSSLPKTKATVRKTMRAIAPESSSTEVTTPKVTASAASKEPASAQWTFLSNHAHVLILLSRDPSVVLRKVALEVGITERAVQRIIADLEAGGIIEREKIGRQNHYRIRTGQHLRHPVESHCTIGQLLALVNNSDENSAS